MNKARLVEILEEVSRPEQVCENKEYKILGVKWYSKGAWIKAEKCGSDIKAKTLYKVQVGDLIYNRLFAWKGSFAIIPKELDGCYVSGEFPGFKVKDKADNIDYVFLCLSLSRVWERCERQSAGVSSISRKRLKVPEFLNLTIPIHPPSKQDEIGTCHSTLKEEFEKLQSRQYESSKLLSKLRQSILQLAVQGKLVPQDPSDEPASTLLEKIKAEKEKLIKEGKIKKQKPLPPIELEEIPYELPEGWGWARLGETIAFMDAGWSPACKNVPTKTENGWGVLKTTSVQPLQFWPEKHKELPEHLQPRPEFETKVGDILVTRAGPKNRVGICCLVQSTRPRLMISDKIIRFHLVGDYVLDRFVALSLNAGASRDSIERQKSGMAESQMNISQVKLRAVPVPVPPRREQERIVAKLDQLMTLCDELESKLRQSEADSEKLMESVVHHLLEA